MLTFEHRVRRQRLDLVVDSEATALTLQSQIKSLNNDVIIPVIRELLELHDRPGRVVQLGKLELDLGRISTVDMPARIAERMREVFGETLREALAGADGRLVTDRPSGQARLDLLTHYLERGNLPSWAPRATGFSVRDLVFELADEDPAGLVRVLRRVGRRRVVLERLVAQLPVVALERLVGLLEPRHAVLIVEYIVELELCHRREPLTRLAQPTFHRLIWLFALAYLIRDHGSQFNRKSFVRAMVEKLALTCGLAFEDLLASLWTAIGRLRETEPLRSLPAIVDGLARELGLLETEDPDDEGEDAGPRDELEELRELVREQAESGAGVAAVVLALLSRPGVDVDLATRALVAERPPPELLRELIAEDTARLVGPLFEHVFVALVARDPKALADAVRVRATRERLLARLVARLSSSALVRLVGLLEPRHAALIVEYIDRLRDAHRDEPIVELGEAEFTRLVWEVALAYLLREPGSQFNRKRFLESLLADLGAAFGTGVEPLLAQLWRALQGLERSEPLHSLPAVVRALLEERPHMRAQLRRGPATAGAAGRLEPAVPETPSDLRGSEHAWSERLGSERLGSERLEPERPGPQHAWSERPGPEHPAARASWHGLAARTTARYDRLERLVHYLRVGSLPWQTWLNPRAGLSSRVELAAGFQWLLASPPLLRAAFTIHPQARRRRAILRALAILDEAGQRTLVEQLGLQPDGSGPHSHSGASVEGPLEPLSTPRLDAAYERAVARVLAGSQLTDTPFEAWTRPEPADEAQTMLASLVEALHAGGQRGELRASERAQLLALAGRHPGELLELLATLGELRQDWCRRLLSDQSTVLELVGSAFGQGHRAALGLVVCAGDELDRELGDERWRSIAAWLDAARAGRSVDELIAISLDRLLGPRISVASRTNLTRSLAQMAAANPRFGRGGAIDPEDRASLRDALGTALAGDSAAATSPTLADDAHPSRQRPVRADALQSLLALVARSLSIPSGEPTAAASPGRARAPTDTARLVAALDRLAERAPGRVDDLLRARASTRRARAHWANALPESVLVRIVGVLVPRRFALFVDVAESIAASWAQTDAGAGARGVRPQMWRVLLAFAVEVPAHERTGERLVAMLFTAFVESVNGAAARRLAREQLWERTHARAQALGMSWLRRALGERRAKLTQRGADVRPPEQPRPRREQPSSGPPRAPRLGLAMPDAAETPNAIAQGGVYIDNAGLVLFGSYLPHWLRALGVYEPESGKLRLPDVESRSRAVHLLQWLVDGRCDAPEPALVLNKLLLGLTPSAVVAAGHQPSPEDLQTCERLLTTVLSHWGALGGTSVTGLRETFLQREARLEPSAEGWRLRVQRKTLDVLVDQIPWTISIVRHSWMEQAIYVSW